MAPGLGLIMSTDKIAFSLKEKFAKTKVILLGIY